MLRRPDVDPAYNDNLPLIYAVGNNHTSIVKILLSDKRVNPATMRKNTLPIGLTLKRSSIRQYSTNILVENPTIQSNSQALEIAIINHNEEIIRLLIQDSRVELYNMSIDEALSLHETEMARIKQEQNKKAKKERLETIRKQKREMDLYDHTYREITRRYGLPSNSLDIDDKVYLLISSIKKDNVDDYDFITNDPKLKNLHPIAKGILNKVVTYSNLVPEENKILIRERLSL